MDHDGNDQSGDVPAAHRIYEGARRMPLDVRPAFVAQSCGDDSELREAVEALLAREAAIRIEPESFVEPASVEPGSGSGFERAHDTPGARVSVAPNEVPADSGAWIGFLDQLRSRGPGHARYVDRGELGRGGMGVVRKVYDLDVRRNVALKRMVLHRGDDGSTERTDASLGRFLEEAQVTGQLDHPGIVPVHELGIDGSGNVYFTMKLVQGESLRAVIEKIQNGIDGWSTTRAVSVLQRVCEAMAYAHAKAVIHRDLKPSNIMVGRYGEVFVMDWGLAHVLGSSDHRDIRIRPESVSPPVDSDATPPPDAMTPESPLVTMDGDVVGTPAYMPPEQAAGRVELVGPRSDLYAIGAILYHVLAGRPPYSLPGVHVSPRALLKKVIEEPPQPVHQLAPRAPGELIAICEKAMARVPRQRYRDMESLGEDLRAYLEHRVVRAYKVGALAELRKWIERNRALAWTAAAALLMIGMLHVWSYSSIARDRNSAVERNRIIERVALQARKDGVTARQDADAARELARSANAARSDLDLLEGHALLDRALDAEARFDPPWPERIDAMVRWLVLDAARLVESKPALENRITQIAGRPIDFSRPFDPASVTTKTEYEDVLLHGFASLHRRIGEFEAGPRAAVEHRLTIARRLALLGIEHPNAVLTWSDAARLLHDADGTAVSAAYRARPIDLVPQPGLVPLGVNAATKLLEFYDLVSACARGDDLDPASLALPVLQPDGSLVPRVPAGVVLVLAPGGELHTSGVAGAEVAAPIDAFFVARHELTQAQWQRLAGEAPSSNAHAPAPDGSGLADHPVESIPAERCGPVLARAGLTLPNELQWEFATRGGTPSPWWPGDSSASLAGAANLADATAAAAGAPWRCEPALDDDAVGHAPVGSYRANPFGLYDVIGNVREACVTSDGARYVARGGGYADLPDAARASLHVALPPRVLAADLGVRPVRPLLR